MWLPPTYRAVVVGTRPGTAWLFKPNKFCLLIVRKTIGVDWTFVSFLFGVPSPPSPQEEKRHTPRNKKRRLAYQPHQLPPLKPNVMGVQAGNSWSFPCTIFHQHRWTQPPCCFTKKPDIVNHNVQSNVTAQMLSGLHLVLTLGPTLAVTLSATWPPLACAGSHGSLTRSGSHLRERWWEYKKGSIPKMFGWTCSPFPHLILNKAEKNHTNVVKSGSGYSDSPYPKVSICPTLLHSQLYCILYIHWNKCFGIKRVGGNVITTLISQQGYATPGSLRRAHVDIGTAQTWLAEWLFYMWNYEVPFQSCNNEHLYITDSRKHSNCQTLSQWDAKQKHSKKKLSLQAWNLVDLRSTPSQSWLSDKVTLLCQETGRPKYLLKQDSKTLDGIGVCVISDYCFAN